MIKSETKSGILFEIEEDALDSMELVDALSDLDDDPGSGIVHVSDLLFTRAGKKKIYKQLERANGRKVKVSDFTAFLAEAFDAIKDIKK